MDTHTSVQITSASWQASGTLSVKLSVAPVSAATAWQVAINSAFGQYAFGAQATKCMPSFAHTTM